MGGDGVSFVIDAIVPGSRSGWESRQPPPVTMRLASCAPRSDRV